MLTNSSSLLSRLQQRLTATKRYRQTLDGVSAPGPGFGHSEWVLSRPLYRFARFDLKSVPKPQRGQALELQIRQWAPFARTDWFLLWDEDSALVWAWDADRLEAAMAANKLKPKGAVVIPETLLHQRQEQGACLVTCMDGVEGQVWWRNALISSRWWPALPSAGDWINFQRDAAVLPDDQLKTVPAPLPSRWAEKPWGKSIALDRSALYGGGGERWIVPAAVVSLLAVTMWYGLQLLKAQDAITEADARFKTLSRKAEPIMGARGAALEALGRVNLLQAIDPYPDQISLLARIAEFLPRDGTYLKDWEFQNGKLKLLISSPIKLVSSDYIKLFQSMGMFKNVQAATTNDPANLVLSMETLPSAEIKPAAEGNESTVKKEADALPLNLPPSPALPGVKP